MAEVIFCQTVGLEIEVEAVNTSKLPLPGGWTTTGDASVEKDVNTLNGIPAVDHTEASSLNLGHAIHGGELLSSILDTQKNYMASIKYICSTLIQRGEPYESDRAGLHVHLSFTSPPLQILKAIIKLGCHLEDVFFLAGGMGYPFRGQANDCSYCRPITTPGPQVILDKNDNLYPCFVIEDLLEAKSVNNFRTRLGDYNDLGTSKYVPIRYHWLNLWNLWNRKHTLEFRIFNRSLKPRYIEAAVELSRAFGNAVMYYAYNPDELETLEVNSVYNARDKESILNTFVSFASSRLETRIIDILLRMMDSTPIESIRFDKQPYWFHLRFHRNGVRSPVHWVGHNYRPSISYNESEVARPRFDDIHNLRASSPRTSAPQWTQQGSPQPPVPLSNDPEPGEDTVVFNPVIDFEEVREIDSDSESQLPSLSEITARATQSINTIADILQPDDDEGDDE